MSSHKPWLLVREPAYFQAVLGCMVKFDRTAKDNPGVVVRFGVNGDGVRPNYQVEAPPDRAQAYRGGGHKPDGSAPGGRYANHELSPERFTVQAVQGLLRRCLDIQSGKIDAGPAGVGP